ncbi:MAG: hypothetical protein K9L28_01840 [Synergistales bacterium]|nr:hypothetical protein [Synergistales bacterium]
MSGENERARPSNIVYGSVVLRGRKDRNNFIYLFAYISEGKQVLYLRQVVLAGFEEHPAGIADPSGAFVGPESFVAALETLLAEQGASAAESGGDRGEGGEGEGKEQDSKASYIEETMEPIWRNRVTPWRVDRLVLADEQEAQRTLEKEIGGIVRSQFPELHATVQFRLERLDFRRFEAIIAQNREEPAGPPVSGEQEGKQGEECHLVMDPLNGRMLNTLRKGDGIVVTLPETSPLFQTLAGKDPDFDGKLTATVVSVESGEEGYHLALQLPGERDAYAEAETNLKVRPDTTSAPEESLIARIEQHFWLVALVALLPLVVLVIWFLRPF